MLIQACPCHQKVNVYRGNAGPREAVQGLSAAAPAGLGLSASSHQAQATPPPGLAALQSMAC